MKIAPPCFHFRYRESALCCVYFPAGELSSGSSCARDLIREKPREEEVCASGAGNVLLSTATEYWWRVTAVAAGLVQAIFGIIESRCPVVFRTTTRCFLVRGPVYPQSRGLAETRARVLPRCELAYTIAQNVARGRWTFCLACCVAAGLRARGALSPDYARGSFAEPELIAPDPTG